MILLVAILLHQHIGEYMNTEKEIIRLAQEVANLLNEIDDLANNETKDGEHIGSSTFFCDAYPFGMSLDEVVAEVRNWVATMGGK